MAGEKENDTMKGKIRKSWYMLLWHICPHLLGRLLGWIIEGQENAVHGDRRQDYSIEPRVRHQLKRDFVDPGVAHDLSIRLSQLA